MIRSDTGGGTKLNILILQIMKRVKCTLIDTLNMNYEEQYDMYLEYCKDNDITPAGDDSSDFYGFVYENVNNDIECFLSNIQYSQNDGTCVVFGSLGLWNGKRDICPEKFDSVVSAIHACVNNADYFIIRQEYSALKVTAFHHDGRNEYTIKLLNELGENTENGDLTNRRYHKTVTGYWF